MDTFQVFQPQVNLAVDMKLKLTKVPFRNSKLSTACLLLLKNWMILLPSYNIFTEYCKGTTVVQTSLLNINKLQT